MIDGNKFKDVGYVTEYFGCECTDKDHVMCVTYYDGAVDNIPEHKEYTFCMQLEPQRWYRRIWIALRYIFNPHINTNWNSTMILTKDMDPLLEFLTQHKEK